MSRILRALALGLSVGLLAVVAGLALVLIVVPKATGSVPLTVLTSSMEPRLPPGTLVVVRPIDPRDIRVGQVVTYQIASGEPEVVTHRVVAISSTSDGRQRFAFRGDANAQDDAVLVQPAQIRGALWYSVPGVGWANDLVNGTARAWVVPIAASALFAYSAVMMALGISPVARRRYLTRYRRSGSPGLRHPARSPGRRPARRQRRHVHLHE